jgi:hypothetical protein
MIVDKIVTLILMFLGLSTGAISSATMIAMKVILIKHKKPIRTTYSYIQSAGYSVWRMIFLFSMSGLSEPFEYTNSIVLLLHSLFFFVCFIGSLVSILALFMDPINLPFVGVLLLTFQIGFSIVCSTIVRRYHDFIKMFDLEVHKKET